jgi:benzoylformate decarboxylase
MNIITPEPRVKAKDAARETTADGGQLSAAAAIVEVLARSDVDTVFCNPGTTELPLIRELTAQESPIRYVLTLHEGAAVSAALGFALTTGRVGVAVVHAMPGLANALSMHFNAYKSGIPLVLLVGQQDRRHQYMNPLLQAEMTDVARSVSKHVWEARTAAELPQVLSRSLAAAASSPAGPVFVSVPCDLWDEALVIDSVEGRPGSEALGVAADSSVAAVASAICAAERPVIVAGDLVGMRRCAGTLAELADACGARVHWSPGAVLANFPTTHELYAGQIFSSEASFERAFGEADLVLLVGAEVTGPFFFSDNPLVPPSCRVLALSESTASSTGALSAETIAVGDLERSIRALAGEVRRLCDSEMAQRVAQRRQTASAAVAASRGRLRTRLQNESALTPMRGGVAVDAILSAAPADVVVVDEGVSNSWISLLGRFDDEVAYVSPGRGGALGFACGVALGAKLGVGERPVLTVVGDGALLYGPHALWTIAHEQLPVVVCVLNNGGYSILKEFFRRGESPATPADAATSAAVQSLSLAEPPIDLLSLAAAFGLSAFTATDANGCRTAVKDAFAAAGPTLIDVRIGA